MNRTSGSTLVLLSLLLTVGLSVPAQAGPIIEYEWTSNEQQAGGDPAVRLWFQFKQFPDVGYYGAIQCCQYLDKIGWWTFWTHSDGTYSSWLLADYEFSIYGASYSWMALTLPNTTRAETIGDYSVMDLENDYFHLCWGKSQYYDECMWVFDSDNDVLARIVGYDEWEFLGYTFHIPIRDSIIGGTWTKTVTVDGVPIPEPTSLLLLGLGLGAIAARRRGGP